MAIRGRIGSRTERIFRRGLCAEDIMWTRKRHEKSNGCFGMWMKGDGGNRWVMSEESRQRTFIPRSRRLFWREGEAACIADGRDGGGPGFQGRQVIFNARCESAMEKPLFCDSMRHSRVVIPATWFYEWNLRKEKNTFYRKDAPALFMAGCCREYEDGTCFVILTTRANASMEPVHDRMPLILEENEIAPWILNEERARDILHKTPCLLERKIGRAHV